MTIFSKNCEGHELEKPLTGTPPDGLDIHSPIPNGQSFGVPEPAEYLSDEYQEQWVEVAKCVELVKDDKWPDQFLLDQGLDNAVPEPLKSHVLDDEGMPSAKKAAALVHMDQPLDLCKEIYTALGGPGLKLRGEYHSTTHFDFLGFVRAYALIAVAISYAMNRAFSAKWKGMGKRPENLFDGLGPSFTTYPEGCPPHPRDPAGHGTMAGVVEMMFHILYNLTPEQSRMVTETCGHFAHYRTFAGVHHAVDNANGLDLGRRMADEFMVSAEAKRLLEFLSVEACLTS